MGKGDGKWKGGFKGGQAGPAVEPSKRVKVRGAVCPSTPAKMLRTTHLKFL